MDGGIPDDAVIGPTATGLELRLDERNDRAASCRVETSRHRPEDLGQGDERHVRDGQRDRLGQAGGTEGPGVRPLHRDDPGIRPQRLGELSATHVESIDTRRAALQQHVGEAAGRGPDVEADEPVRIDSERVEGGRELVAAAADVRVALLDLERREGVDEIAGLAVRSRPVPGPDAHPAGEQEGLGPRTRRGQPTVDEKLVEADAAGSRDGRAHEPIVAQGAARRRMCGPLPAWAGRQIRARARSIRPWRQLPRRAPAWHAGR